MAMKSSSYVLSVDLGGTNLRVGAVRDDGVLEKKEKYLSDARVGSAVLLGRIADHVKGMARRMEERGIIQGVALGFPGIVDPEKGIVYKSPHFPDWHELDLLSFFRREFPWPVIVDNDANMAALGEAWKGAGQGHRNFVMLTFGTGLGGGIIIDQKIYHGDRGFAGELGHVVIESQGHRCACGGRGCLEMYVSTQGILKLIETSDDRFARDKFLEPFGGVVEKVTVEYLYKMALDGDIFAHTTFKRMGYYLGIGLASLANTLGIETFLLGGGISEASDFFMDAAKRELGERAYREVASHVQIKKAALGDHAGLIGGAASFFRKD